MTIDDLIAKIETGEATSADLSVATKILKDNAIDVHVESDDPKVVKLDNISSGRFQPKVKNG